MVTNMANENDSITPDSTDIQGGAEPSAAAAPGSKTPVKPR